jgi:two-component system chemotaxis sensor kinase CheA
MAQRREKLLAIFRDELTENLDQLVLRLEQLRAGGGAAPRETVDGAFRIAHNLKGASRIVGMLPISDLAHAMEEVLSPLRGIGAKGEAPAPPDLDLLFEAVTVMGRLGAGEDLAATAQDLTAALTKSAPRAPERPAAESAAVRSLDVAAASESSVRVEIGRLDRLMAATGELLVTQARQAARFKALARLAGDLRAAGRQLPPAQRPRFVQLSRALDAFLREEGQERRRFGYLTDEIGTAMKRVRMLPLSGLAAQWRSIVRDAAERLGKEVHLTVEVGNIELDKHILDGLRDPLMHVLRNAVAHGIEAPAGRRAAGKPEAGTIVVRASMRGSMVQVEVGDDGRGLDPAAIAAAAERRRVATSEQLARMDEAEVCDLLFAPGFSTADTVTEISGRGVGLDVARQRLRELGGHVAIRARGALGGAALELTLPVSLVSTRGLLVRVGPAIFALPVEYVERTLRIGAGEVQRADGVAAIPQADGEPLPVRWLATLMGIPREPDPGKLTIVVLARGASRLGLVAGEVLGEEELVTKRLPWNLKRVKGIHGAAILGDGRLAVVVDPLQAFDATRSAAETVLVAAATTRPRVMVVDDSLTSRALERSILEAAGYEVVVMVDGRQAWEALRQEPVDLVVADVEMPEMDGLELTRRIRAESASQHLPVILVTSLGSDADLAAGADAGADAYIVKGRFDQRELLAAVKRLV